MPDHIDRTDQTQYVTMAFGLLGAHEKEIVVDLIQRLVQGQREYGKFQDLDRRDFNRESYEEAIDLSVYLTRLVKRLAYLG
jgi:hypothetical protein